MAAAFPCHLPRPIPASHTVFRRPAAFIPSGTLLPPIYSPKRGSTARNHGHASRLLARSSSVEQKGAGTDSMTRLVQFLYEDLPHLFDERGIDRSMYDYRVRFRVPITRHDTIGGYLFNIRLLKLLFDPEFQLHHVKQDLMRSQLDGLW